MDVRQTTRKKRQDPRDVPLYTVAEAARYLHIPAPTVRSWVQGRYYPRRRGKARFLPVIELPETRDSRISFRNLVELAALRALRTRLGFDIKAVREALDFAKKEFKVDHLLASRELYAMPAGDLFLKTYGELINLNRAGQYGIREMLESLVERIDWDDRSPVRFFPPLPLESQRRSKSIVIDPRIAFGHPVLASKSISTGVIADRVNAGEELPEIARDYGVTEDEIKDALAYELAA